MKKIMLGAMLLILLSGVSGCMFSSQPQKQSHAEENKETEAAMLTYLKDKYKQDFTSVEYIPAKRGFNDSYNENVLVAKSSDGFLVNAKEKLAYQGEFYDDYLNSYATHLSNNEIDYSGIKSLWDAKTYVTLYDLKQKPEEVLNGNFTLTNENIHRRYSVIAISKEADEKVLAQLYDVYQQMYRFGNEGNTFIVAFSGDESKAKKYVDNFFLHGINDWEQYDKSVKEIIRIAKKVQNFDEFKKRLTEVGG
ncbi:hypothetical protein [Bacillus sp. B-jedd]|uniref:hypothetical protein n=1 Tax=Bacillus sp. B-jedd TaxID=1476857 RepID=UPI000515615F|nr:hypothetical protein [Bacillus sp. B-jedd]CEG28526.1 hypothetical protein BN1002_03447 [Bacillus sp. B-jedd]